MEMGVRRAEAARGRRHQWEVAIGEKVPPCSTLQLSTPKVLSEEPTSLAPTCIA